MLRLPSIGAALPTASALAVAVALCGCGGGGSKAKTTSEAGTSGAGGSTAEGAGGSTAEGARSDASSSLAARAKGADPAANARPAWPPRISVLRNPVHAGDAWTPVASVDGRTAAWVSQTGPVTLMRLDQQVVHLSLHAGYGEPPGEGWPGGDQIGPEQAPAVVAGFNGGFRLNLPEVGFALHRRVAVPLQQGLASVVTYADGRTDIGSWQEEVPRRGAKVASVLQNLHLLIDGGKAAGNLESCVQECWGATLGGGVDVARSALGIRPDGQLVWAGGESLSPAAIADALLSAGVSRAAQLDINPEWVASYLYVHRGSGLSAMQVTPSQPGIPGQLLAPYNRDFFTVLANMPMKG